MMNFLKLATLVFAASFTGLAQASDTQYGPRHAADNSRRAVGVQSPSHQTAGVKTAGLYNLFRSYGNSYRSNYGNSGRSNYGSGYSGYNSSYRPSAYGHRSTGYSPSYGREYSNNGYGRNYATGYRATGYRATGYRGTSYRGGYGSGNSQRGYGGTGYGGGGGGGGGCYYSR